jgi:hypothetical protein
LGKVELDGALASFDRRSRAFPDSLIVGKDLQVVSEEAIGLPELRKIELNIAAEHTDCRVAGEVAELPALHLVVNEIEKGDAECR